MAPPKDRPTKPNEQPNYARKAEGPERHFDKRSCDRRSTRPLARQTTPFFSPRLDQGLELNTGYKLAHRPNLPTSRPLIHEIPYAAWGRTREIEYRDKVCPSLTLQLTHDSHRSTRWDKPTRTSFGLVSRSLGCTFKTAER